MWIDDAGRYQGFRATRCDYRAYGPCLTDVRYVEETAGGEIASCVNVSIARSDDYVRAFHHLRYDVRQPVSGSGWLSTSWARIITTTRPNAAWRSASAKGLHEEWQPIRAKDVYERRGVALTGDQPWISIHWLERAALNQGGAIASRGLIVRSWKAVLGGKPCHAASRRVLRTEYGKGNFRTVIELSPPPDVPALQRGDFVEADIEWSCSRLTRRLTMARTLRSRKSSRLIPTHGGWCSARRRGMRCM